ncbi:MULTISPECIES: oxidoreductase-like domain-containing protein [unclassified Lysobacter]
MPGNPSNPVPTPTSDDPPPLLPERPLPMDCCDSGCERCVSDIYADEMDHYQVLLAAWRARNPGRDPDAG